MRHGKRGRKLGVVGAHRRAMAKNMIQSLIDNERVITTIPKAKHIQPLAEKVINLAKEQTLNNVRRAAQLMGSRELQIEFVEDDKDSKKKNIHTVLQKLFDDIGPRNKNRKGGYTRILRLAKRRIGDSAERCIFELVENNQTEVTKPAKKKDEKKEAVAS